MFDTVPVRALVKSYKRGFAVYDTKTPVMKLIAAFETFREAQQFARKWGCS